jgi:hypothetical protein
VARDEGDQSRSFAGDEEDVAAGVGDEARVVARHVPTPPTTGGAV